MNAFQKVVVWVTGHPWQISTGMLAVALAAVLVIDRGPAAVTASSTSTTAASSTTAGPAQPGATTTTATIPVGERVDPFTGVTRGGGPLVIVKVDNAPEARPQIGLTEADLIVEVPVEGGLTRFTAVYLDELPELVGPVRSLRPVDADLLAPFPGMVVASGGQRHVLGSVAATGAVLVSPDESAAFQTLERPRPHHLFVDVGAVAGDVPLPPAAPWSYGAWGGGEAASAVSIPYGSETVEWRSEEGTWARYSNGEPTDVLSGPDGPGSSLNRDTVILLFAHQKSGGYTDSAGAEVPDFDIVGGGEVWILHGGELAKGTWLRATQTEPWTFTAADGSALSVPLGSLYLAIVPTGMAVTTAS